MTDHHSIHLSDSLPLPAMYRFQTQGQRSSHSLFQNSSMGRLNQYGDNSNLLCEPANSCAATEAGIDEQISSAYWDMESQPLALNRTKALAGVYEEEWNSNSQQHDAMEHYGGTGGNHQKLDSFSEAFYGRSICRITGSNGVQGSYNHASNNSSPPPPPLPSLSFPLLLSPPPTPLPPSSLSPPKRAPHPPAAQTPNQTQSQSPSEGSLRFFSPLNFTSSVLPSSFSSAHWLPLSTDACGSGDLMQHLPQDPTPSSSIYPEGVALHQRHLGAIQREPDCSLETSPCSPLAHHPQPIPKLLEHDPLTSEDHMTWSQSVQSSQSSCPPFNQSHTEEQQRVAEDRKPSSALQRTHLLCLSSSQNTASAIYTGAPFHSVLKSGVQGDNYWHSTPHYTPPPMLNPMRNGTGLFCKLLSPLENRGLWSEGKGHNSRQRCVNIGPEYQAELPDLMEREELEEWQEEPLQEELLWKPWAELNESDPLQQRVENLLDLSTSAALPGGCANLELALHSLSLCQGNIMAALEMMFFSNSTPSKDYHYAGSDVWHMSEQKLFHKAFTLYGKDFSFIHKMVKTKRTSQCVEFYYHSKHLQDKQRKQKEIEKEQQQQQMNAETAFASTNQMMTPAKTMMNSINMERLIQTPSLATSFPCKQCGKMFYKIKSRNAHMKIHRQQQEDWRERIHPNSHHNLNHSLQNQGRTLTHPNQLVTQTHQNQLLTQSLIQNLVQSQAQLAFLQNGKTTSGCFTTAINSMGPTQSPQTAPKAPTLPLYTGHQQAWGALHGNLESTVYYDQLERAGGV